MGSLKEMIDVTNLKTNEPSAARGFYWACAWSALFAVPLVFVVAAGGWFAHQAREFRKAVVRRSQQDFDQQFTQLKSGKTNKIYFYDTSDTERLIAQLDGAAEVEDLQLDLTDATDDCMHYVAELPNLRTLVLYGGNPGIGDRGLESLKDKDSIESLQLINTRVTNDGLKVLQSLKGLRSLTVYFEAWRGTGLSDAGLSHLKSLRTLETLTVGGGWASAEGIKELKSAIPQCDIVTQPSR